jgi:hypothetical protein
MRYAIERWKGRYWKLYVYDDDGMRVMELASLYNKHGLYVNGTLCDPRYRELFVTLAYRLADASAGGSNVETVREVIEDVLGG